MICFNEFYPKDIIINDCLKLVFKNKKSQPLLTDQNIVFISGFTGSGKSTLLKKLAKNLHGFAEIPERRYITLKCIIEPYANYFNLKHSFNKREDRIAIVKSYKKNIPEGIVFALKHIEITQDLPKGFIFDGIRGEEELKKVLETFKKAKVIVLKASKEIRLNRILERNDPYDQISSSNNITANKIIENDLNLHGDFKEYHNKRVISIYTDEMNQEEVYITAYNWILNDER